MRHLSSLSLSGLALAASLSSLLPVTAQAETGRADAAKTNPAALPSTFSARPLTVARSWPSEQRLDAEASEASASAAQTARERRIERQFHKAGADFIKLHFADFRLPKGAYVLVSSADGQELYRYEAEPARADNRTFDRSLGEDGLRQFAAMSVFGERARLTLVLPAGVRWGPDHALHIDRFHAGQIDADEAAGRGPGSGPAPLSVCGGDERRDPVCLAASHAGAVDRSRPVARLLMAGSGLCTGWRVGADNRMFTNNHCLSTQNTLSNTEVWFNYERTSCGGSTLAAVTKVTGQTLLKTDATLDYSLFTINDFAKVASFGYLGLDPRAAVKGEPIFIAQHGGGKPKQLAVTSDQNGGAACQIDNASVAGNASGTDVAYFCDTEGGSSGSPVIAAGSRKVLALHHFGGCTNQGVQISKIWPQVASHFNNQVPGGDDGGNGSNRPPVAEFSSSCNGLVCSFNGSASSDSDGRITRYDWQFGDGRTASGAQVSNSYLQAGRYSATLSVTDDRGASGSKSQDVVLSNNTPLELQSGVPVNNLGAAKDQTLSYFIKTTQPGTQVLVGISGGAGNSGNADLYVRAGAEPTSTQYDCRPALSGNTENCTLLLAAPGTAYIKLVASTAFTGVNLLASLQVGNSGYPKTGLAATKGNWLRYVYTVPAGRSSVTFSTSGGSGDADLYLRRAEAPDTSNYQCRSNGSTNKETCTLTVNAGETIHIGLRAYSSFSGLTLDLK